MRSMETNAFEIMSIPNKSYEPFRITKNRKMTERVSDFNMTIPPTDAYFNHQWAFQNQNNHADINITEAWETYLLSTDNSNNGKEVIVAIIDSGIDYNHPDLKDVMWKNPGEIPDNGIDDDLNGFIDDVYGVDFTGENCNDEECDYNVGDCCGDPMDTHGHGTHCSGIIYAKPNGGGKLGAGVASYTHGKVNIFYLLV